MVDGIFAIAMTILVLGITPPKPDISQAQAVLAGQIVGILPEIFIFIVSFLILAGILVESSPAVPFRPDYRFTSALD